MKKWIARRYSGYTSGGKLWLTVGLCALIVDMAIGFSAGSAQATIWHGLGGAGLALGFAFLPDAAYEEMEGKRYVSALLIAALCVPIGIKAYEQQLTYSTGMRNGEIQLTNVVNTKYSGAQDDVKRINAELAVLMAVQENLAKEAPWAATVKADGLRSQVATLEKAIAEEGGKHNGGCKRRCLDLMKQKTDAEARIAMAEKVETNEARIKELQAMIDAKRAVANKTEHRSSLNTEVAITTARLVKLVSGYSAGDAIKTGEEDVAYATLGSAGLGSFALLALAPIGFFLAGRRRKPGFKEDEPVITDTPVSGLGNRTPEPRAYPPAPVKDYAIQTKTLADVRADLRRIAAA